MKKNTGLHKATEKSQKLYVTESSGVTFTEFSRGSHIGAKFPRPFLMGSKLLMLIIGL